MDTLDCGHAPGKGAPANVDGKIVQGWQFVLLDDGRKVCHACADSVILDCGHKPSPHAIFTTGYGLTADGKKACYECCGKEDKARMIKTGRATLYLSKNGKEYALSNWPGSLVFRVRHVRKGRHSTAGARYDAQFTGPDGKPWHAVQYGDDTQLAHCRRLKY